MSDLVRAEFVGGPGGPFYGMTPPTMLHDRVNVYSGVMAIRKGEGVAIVKRDKLKRTDDWISYTRHVYEKAGEVVDGRITYRYVATVEVMRCEARTTKGRQCRHDARPGEQFCNTHHKPQGEAVNS